VTSWRSLARTVEIARSQAWDAAIADATVVVATHERAAWLPELVAHLEAQQGPPLELVVVDDGSTDGTADVLRRIAAKTRLPMLTLHAPVSSGPSAARNAGVAAARTGRLLLTDDDCLPAPTWAAALVRALDDDGASVVQGRTVPAETSHGPWDRTITVAEPTPLYETCNLGLDMGAFRSAGGFAELNLLRRTGARGFGEDAELGARVARSGRREWAPDAVVRHRWVNGSFRDSLAAQWRLVGFGALVALVPEVDAELTGRVFLSRRTVVTDAGVGAIAVALTRRRPAVAVLALPWMARLLTDARARPGRSAAVRAAQLAAIDVVGAAALVVGSARARRLVL
jgi:hypothetical protein